LFGFIAALEKSYCPAKVSFDRFTSVFHWRISVDKAWDCWPGAAVMYDSVVGWIFEC